MAQISNPICFRRWLFVYQIFLGATDSSNCNLSKYPRSEIQNLSDNYFLSFVFDNIISTFPPFMFTFHSSSSPAPRSISFTTPSGMVVLSEDELGLAIVTFVLNSPTTPSTYKIDILIWLFEGNKFIYIYVYYP